MLRAPPPPAFALLAAIAAGVALGCAGGARGPSPPGVGSVAERRRLACAAPALGATEALEDEPAAAPSRAEPEARAEPASAPGTPSPTRGGPASDRPWSDPRCDADPSGLGIDELSELAGRCFALQEDAEPPSPARVGTDTRAAEAEDDEDAEPFATGDGPPVDRAAAAPLGPDAGATDGQESPRIAEVRLVGLRTLPEAAAREALGLDPGAPFDREALAEGVRRLVRLGVVDDVRVRPEPTAGGLALEVAVVERPLVSRVFVEGPGARGALSRRLRLLEGQVRDPARLVRLAARLRSELRDQGYLEAEVEVRARPVGEGAVDLCVALEPGPRLLIERVAVVGASLVGEEELLAAIDSHGGRVNTVGRIYRPDLLEASLPLLSAVLYDHGLLESEVGLPVVRRVPGRDRIVVEVPVEEREPFTLRHLVVSGEPEEAVEEARRAVGLGPGDLFVRRAVASAVARVEAVSRARGAPVRVSPEIALDPRSHTVDLRLVVERE